MENKDILLILVFGLFGWYSTQGFKSQFIRILDILVYGPLLIYIGLTKIKNNDFIKMILLFFGASTITYNLKNYLSHT